jgi:hypothetical protein
MHLSSSRLHAAVVVTVVSLVFVAAAQPYTWQQPNATVIGSGDLLLAQNQFQYTPGASVIYIDYDGGSDANSGTSTGSAFKHHPWDANATGTARSTSGIHTYVFKRGVIYRGTLIADDNGAAG